MFEKIVKAITPFGLSLVAISGLALVGRVPVVDRTVLGYATIFVAVILAIVHVASEVRSPKLTTSKRKD